MRRHWLIAPIALCFVFAAAPQTARADASPAPLIAKPAIAVPRSPGSFDYMYVDAARRYLLVAHTGSKSMDVFNLDTGALLRQVNVGSAHGIAIDVKDRKYFVSTVEGVVAVVDRDNLVLNDRPLTPGPGDAMAFDPKNNTVYVDEDAGTRIFTVSGRTNKPGPVITIPQDPEYLNYDPGTDKLYQNIVSTNAVLVIDPATNAVTATWSTLPATTPHGQAIDSAAARMFIAGSNGILVMMDMKSGAIMGQAPIAPRVDQIAFDPGTQRVYCASGTGLLSVVQETTTGLVALPDVIVPEHAHTVAVDPSTHAVWISYGGSQTDFIMQLTPP
jgi:DNA-binding beta-propeller fold protein YncE